MTDVTHLAWIDLETSGLEKDCHVLEVAMVVTDSQLVEVAWFDTLCFNGNLVELGQMAANLDSVVRDMHTKNGLLRALNVGLNHNLRLHDGEERQSVYTYKWVDSCMSAILESIGPPRSFLLAGSGCRFDRPHIERCFPDTAKMLHYADLDVGVMRRFTDLLGMGWMVPSPNKESIAHRAMADTLSHLDQARAFGDFLTRAAILKGDAP